jgi:hypothetical protein
LGLKIQTLGDQHGPLAIHGSGAIQHDQRPATGWPPFDGLAPLFPIRLEELRVSS